MANQKTVLLCDDDEAELTRVATALRQHGYDVTTLQDAATLVTQVLQRRYALVVVNPDMSGFDAAAVCTSIKKEAGIPVLLLLNPDSTTRNSIDTCTADDVMTKPAETDILANLLDKNYTWSKAVKGSN